MNTYMIAAIVLICLQIITTIGIIILGRRRGKRMSDELDEMTAQYEAINQWKKDLTGKAINHKKTNPIRNKSREPIVKGPYHEY